MIDRGAQESEFGWQFQIYSAITLALKNIENTKFINIEGPKQDVELILDNGKIILGQAKAYGKVDVEESTTTNWKSKLESGIVGLFEDFLDKNKNTDFKYLVNYPYPLGKINGGKTNFKPNEYGAIFGDELTARQKGILKETILNSDDKQITQLSTKELNGNLNSFINQLSIETCNFTNFRENNRRYSSLNNLIKDFLDTNHFNVSVNKLRDYWISQGFKNGSQKLALSRIDFLFGIAIVDNTLTKDELFGRKISISSLNKLFDRFINVIESVISLEDFNRKLVANILEFFKIDDINDYIYDDIAAESFTDFYIEDYVSYFKIQSLTEKEQRLLTRFALARCLEEQDLFIRIIGKGELKNVY